MMEKYQHEVSEAQAALYEEGQNKIRLQMELDAKESEIEALRQKLTLSTSDNVSLLSANDSELASGSSSSAADDNFLGEFFQAMSSFLHWKFDIVKPQNSQTLLIISLDAQIEQSYPYFLGIFPLSIWNLINENFDLSIEILAFTVISYNLKIKFCVRRFFYRLLVSSLQNLRSNLWAVICHYTLGIVGILCMLLLILFSGENRLEGWLAVPNKQNIKRYGWKKQYVVVSSKKILFYSSENSKMNADPILVLDIECVSLPHDWVLCEIQVVD